MKRVMRNERRVRRLKRRMIQSSGSTRDEFANNEDVKCLIPNSTSTEEEEERQADEVEDGKRMNEVLDTTTDTEYS